MLSVFFHLLDAKRFHPFHHTPLTSTTLTPDGNRPQIRLLTTSTQHSPSRYPNHGIQIQTPSRKSSIIHPPPPIQPGRQTHARNNRPRNDKRKRNRPRRTKRLPPQTSLKETAKRSKAKEAVLAYLCARVHVVECLCTGVFAGGFVGWMGSREVERIGG